MKRKEVILSIFLFLGINYFILISSAVEPFGATNLTIINSTRASSPEPQSIKAQAGNVTEINLFGYTITQAWQGYYGNVTGTIHLADAANNVMYNWSNMNPRGEVYASTSISINWQYVQCFNFSADGSYNEDDKQNAGKTSLYGTNLTMLESQYNIKEDSVDGVNETFNLFGVGGHAPFYTNNLYFEEGECRSTRTFTGEGSSPEDKFDEVLLYEPTTRSIIFAALLNPKTIGFDNKPHDFQMIVLEDGHKDNTETTTYYFWVELE